MCLTCGYNDCVCHYELQKKSTDIPRSSLPPLPAGWCGPWEAQWTCLTGMHKGKRKVRLATNSCDEAQFLAALLNVTHPAKERES